MSFFYGKGEKNMSDHIMLLVLQFTSFLFSCGCTGSLMKEPLDHENIHPPIAISSISINSCRAQYYIRQGYNECFYMKKKKKHV